MRNPFKNEEGKVVPGRVMAGMVAVIVLAGFAAQAPVAAAAVALVVVLALPFILNG